MFLMEYEATEAELMMLIQESVHDPANSELRETIIDPIIEILETKKGRDEYIKYGNEFLEANAEMLSKEYPTGRVSFPRKYVDSVLELFGFTVSSLKEKTLKILKSVNEFTSFRSITENPTNVVHTIVLFYSDMILHRELRDSARQQLGLSVYSALFNSSFPKGINESVMAYTYMNRLNGTWLLVKSENMVNWIGLQTDTVYARFRTKLSVNMSPKILVDFMNAVRTTFRQSIVNLARLYYQDIEENNQVGNDIEGSDEYVTTNNFSKIRNNLIRRIKSGDELYHRKDNLYPKIARLKNVKSETLYEFAKKIDSKDISNIIDNIFYVFIIKEGNKVEDINSTKFISRITNLPTAVDRAINGKPVILPLSKKYETDSSIVKAYICLVATYIMMRINDVNK